MYELVDPERTGGLAPLNRRVAPGTSLLVAGPVMTRKERLVSAILAPGHAAGGGVTMVSTEDHADAIEDRFAEFVDVDESRFGLVDCTGQSSDEGLSGPGRVQHVPSPNDLTGVGIGITRALESLSVRGDGYRLGLDSLSTLLAYRSPEDVFKFCHVLATRLANLGCISVHTLDTDAHDDRTVNMIARAFDGSIDIRQAPADASHGRSYELRLRGFDGGAAWQPAALP
jgi:KaiC/GvpD/RAD55 family RecA-like ATPase